jgi:hypothetical protein
LSRCMWRDTHKHLDAMFVVCQLHWPIRFAMPFASFVGPHNTNPLLTLSHVKKKMCYDKHQGAFQPLTVITWRKALFRAVTISQI